jgi:aminoglycoside phosphotransferase (APT) family kinase protein
VRTESDAGPRSDALELAAARALAERNPESRPVLAAALAELMARADRLREPRPRVQTHGTFTAGHVFVSRDCVTAIDLDEAHPGDPAEDLAYFAFWLRFGPVREGVGPAAAPDAVKLFLDEYARRHPVDAGALAYHWSVQVVQHWAMALRKRQPSPRAVVRRGFLAAEFAAVPSLAGAG